MNREEALHIFSHSEEIVSASDVNASISHMADAIRAEMAEEFPLVLSVMGGFRASLIGRLIGMNGHVVITAQGGGMLETTPDLLAALRNVPGAKTVHLKIGRAHV